MFQSAAVLPRPHRLAVALAALAALAAAIGLSAIRWTGPGERVVRATPAPAPANSLEAVASRSPAQPVEAIVQLGQGVSPEAGRRALLKEGARITRALPIVNGFVVAAPAGRAEALERLPQVKAASLNAAVNTSGGSDATCRTVGALCYLRTSYPYGVNADYPWTDKGFRVTGRGVGVAVIDSGIDAAHPDFRTSSTNGASRVVTSVVANPTTSSPDDAFGHGTHVAGIIAGNSKARPAASLLRGAYQGVAPDANLINVKVADDQGVTTLADVITGLQWVVDHKGEYGIRVVNLSLTSSVAESYKTDPLDAAVESAWFKGLVVVVAAGNAGSAADAVSYAPANDPYVISVGALDDRQTHDYQDDTLASWSSRGQTQDGVVKPELHASGARVVAPLGKGAQYASDCPTCVVDGEYIQLGGTSMAAPVISGAAALLLEEHPSWTPNQIKGALIGKARETREKRLVPDLEPTIKLDSDDSELASANRGLVPSEYVSSSTGEVDWTRMSFRRMSFRRMSFRSDGSTALWSCDGECGAPEAGNEAGGLSRMSFRVNWQTSFTK